METQMQQRTPPLRGTLYRVLETRFCGDPRAINLCSEFLSHETYDRRFVTKLISVCDGSAGYSWTLRLFAENLRRYKAGEPLINRVDFEAGY